MNISYTLNPGQR